MTNIVFSGAMQQRNELKKLNNSAILYFEKFYLTSIMLIKISSW